MPSDSAQPRRTSVASGIFEVMDQWHEILKAAFLRQTPDGYRRVSWGQLRAVDEALWPYTAYKCERGTKASPGTSTTAFQTAFKEGMVDLDVRQHLHFLPGSSSSSASNAQLQTPASRASTSSDIQKLRNKLMSTEQQLHGAKRKMDNNQNTHYGDNDKKGKGKGDKRRGQTARPNGNPPEFAGMLTQTAGGDRICYAFNKQGCSLAATGQKCNRGMHVCIKCAGQHPLTACAK